MWMETDNLMWNMCSGGHLTSCWFMFGVCVCLFIVSVTTQTTDKPLAAADTGPEKCKCVTVMSV